MLRRRITESERSDSVCDRSVVAASRDAAGRLATLALGRPVKALKHSLHAGLCPVPGSLATYKVRHLSSTCCLQDLGHLRVSTGSSKSKRRLTPTVRDVDVGSARDQGAERGGVARPAIAENDRLDKRRP